jgi:hypothetical protein
MNTKQEIWLTLTREKYPTLTEYQLASLLLESASQWLHGEDNELSQLFDQYVMLKNLKDL